MWLWLCDGFWHGGRPLQGKTISNVQNSKRTFIGEGGQGYSGEEELHRQAWQEVQESKLAVVTRKLRCR